MQIHYSLAFRYILGTYILFVWFSMFYLYILEVSYDLWTCVSFGIAFTVILTLSYRIFDQIEVVISYMLALVLSILFLTISQIHVNICL